MFNSSEGVPMTMPVVPQTYGGGNGGVFGEGSWLIWILLIFAIFGFGNGYGFGGSNGSGAVENYVLNSDFSELSRQLDSSTDRLATLGNNIANGLCDGFYTQAQLINGVNTNISNSTAAITNAITTGAYENQLGQQSIGTQIAAGIAGIGTQISDTNYNIATQANGITNAVTSGFCQTNYNAANNTRDIVDSQNAGTQAILARIDAMESSRKDEKIAELTAMNSDLRLAASQAAQNSYLVDQLGQKPPVSAYVVPNPYCNCNSCCSGCGC